LILSLLSSVEDQKIAAFGSSYRFCVGVGAFSFKMVGWKDAIASRASSHNSIRCIQVEHGRLAGSLPQKAKTGSKDRSLRHLLHQTRGVAAPLNNERKLE
jgi:D-tyrosyl-tRNA(Tyr) deacylase